MAAIATAMVMALVAAALVPTTLAAIAAAVMMTLIAAALVAATLAAIAAAMMMSLVSALAALAIAATGQHRALKIFEQFSDCRCNSARQRRRQRQVLWNRKGSVSVTGNHTVEKGRAAFAVLGERGPRDSRQAERYKRLSKAGNRPALHDPHPELRIS